MKRLWAATYGLMLLTTAVFIGAIAALIQREW